MTTQTQILAPTLAAADSAVVVVGDTPVTIMLFAPGGAVPFNFQCPIRREVNGAFQAVPDANGAAFLHGARLEVTFYAPGNYLVHKPQTEVAVGFFADSSSNLVLVSSPVKWDSMSGSGQIAFSNSDLRISTSARGSTSNAFQNWARSNHSRSSGKYVVRGVVTYLAPAFEAEVGLAVATPQWGGAINSVEAWVLTNDTSTTHGGGGSSVPGPIPTNTGVRIFVDFDAGKMWMGTDSDMDGNPETGVGEMFTFAPNTELFVGGGLFTIGGVNASLELDPAFSSGSFLPW